MAHKKDEKKVTGPHSPVFNSNYPPHKPQTLEEQEEGVEEGDTLGGDLNEPEVHDPEKDNPWNKPKQPPKPKPTTPQPDEGSQPPNVPPPPPPPK
jgi:hypothetical protein